MDWEVTITVPISTAGNTTVPCERETLFTPLKVNFSIIYEMNLALISYSFTEFQEYMKTN